MIYSFDPIINNDSRTLLLGTMPGLKSLEKHEYYGHKNNQFWKIIFTIFNRQLNPETNYEDKIHLILENKLALWDVLACCIRKGSADSAIYEETPNDFGLLFSKYPGIRYVFFTSRNAEMYYKRLVGIFPSNLAFDTLPSPSTAYARLNVSQKIERWKKISFTLETE